MTARIELYETVSDSDDPIAWTALGHVPRAGETILLNAKDDLLTLVVDRVEWFMDDARVEEMPQVSLYVTSRKTT